MLTVLQRARTLFPFPILGIDTDNGTEFLNEEVVAYCEHERITFTRGRPSEKRDQCFVEQKNGVVVRQVVGYDRFEGEHAARQLGELYRALRLYVNCFQPSIESYLQEHRKAKHSAKTLEWHQTALSQFQQYLLAERHLLQISQITEADVDDWFTFLQQTPTSAGLLRSACTVETYARSVRAFCNWLVHRGELAHTPLSERSFPWAGACLPSFLPPEAFEQFALACQPTEGKGIDAQHVVARDRAILWVLFDTGITVSGLGPFFWFICNLTPLANGRMGRGCVQINSFPAHLHPLLSDLLIQ